MLIKIIYLSCLSICALVQKIPIEEFQKVKTGKNIQLILTQNPIESEIPKGYFIRTKNSQLEILNPNGINQPVRISTLNFNEFEFGHNNNLNWNSNQKSSNLKWNFGSKSIVDSKAKMHTSIKNDPNP